MEFGHKLLVASVHAKGVLSNWNTTHPELSVEDWFGSRCTVDGRNHAPSEVPTSWELDFSSHDLSSQERDLLVQANLSTEYFGMVQQLRFSQVLLLKFQRQDANSACSPPFCFSRGLASNCHAATGIHQVCASGQHPSMPIFSTNH